MKQQRYIVSLGDGRIIECYRTWTDWAIWDNPFSAFVRFRLDNGNIIEVSKHFTISVEMIKGGKDDARTSVRKT